MLTKSYDSIYTANSRDGINITDVERQDHPSSRATRLVDDSTRFLLVSVHKRADNSNLRQTLPNWIREGVQIHGVSYRFLGFTESHVKAGKLMFFREDGDWTVQRVLSSFGDLPSVYLKSGYGKYSARLGLSFSSTVESLDIPHELALEIPDLVATDGSLHSDGCGMIRDSYAAQVCERHSLPPDTSVFQIRRGGIKGLLVRYPDETFDRLCRNRARMRRGTNVAIAYRPSMYKYGGGPTNLELNNHSSPPASARLNIQFMVHLLTLGVPFSVFERLVQDQLDLIGSILTDREKAFMYVKGELDAAADDDYAQSLYAMLLAQQNMSEPSVRQSLLRFQRKQYEFLRSKMALRISDSCYLFGVVDEEGILSPNEVYVNLPSRSGVLARDVIIARNPSYHPGDMRKMRAVDRPALRHHKNCVVFPSTASHSVPDSMASGDLDGDMYFVCWDPDLIPPKEIAPLDRTPSAASGAAPTRSLSDMPTAAVQTFMQLKFNRLLGMMANEWTKQVEMSPELAEAPYPRELAPLIESALESDTSDLMKSGEDFERLERRFKSLKNQYGVRDLNGFVSPIQRLRDMVPQLQNARSQVLDGSQCDDDMILRSEDPDSWRRLQNEAVAVMGHFNRQLSQAIKLDEDSLEIVSSSKLEHTPPSHVDRVKQDYRRRYFGGGSRRTQNEQRMRASAWYHYGYTHNKSAFAWLGERYLNEIKAWRTNGNRPPMFVGAVTAQPLTTSSPPARMNSLAVTESQATLVDDQADDAGEETEVDEDSMDVDPAPDENPPLKPRAGSSSSPTCARRDAIPIPTGPTRPRCNALPSPPSVVSPAVTPEPLHRVSVASNPKPRTPTTYAGPCSQGSGAVHNWNRTANGFWRRYLCLSCGLEVHEKKKDGYWAGDRMVLNKPIGALPMVRPDHCPESPNEPESASQTLGSPATLSTVQEDPASDTDSDDHMSIYESASESPQPSQGSVPAASPRASSSTASPRVSSSTAAPAPRRTSGRTSGGTAVSDAPSSLAGLPQLRRFPARAGQDVSSPVMAPRMPSGSSRARQVSGSTRRASGSSTTSARAAPVRTAQVQDWPRVADEPKPKQPVATRGVPACTAAGARHEWSTKGSNGSQRIYTCRTCRHVVKERKSGETGPGPVVWVPAE